MKNWVLVTTVPPITKIWVNLDSVETIEPHNKRDGTVCSILTFRTRKLEIMLTPEEIFAKANKSEERIT